MEPLKVGDLIEDCSLVPGIIMHIVDNEYELSYYIRKLTDEENYGSNDPTHYASCGEFCGVMKITPDHAKNLLILTNQERGDIYKAVSEDPFITGDNFHETFIERVAEAVKSKFK